MTSTIRRRLFIFLLLLGGSIAGEGSGTADDANPATFWVFVGTYTKGTKSKGIYRYDLDMASGKLSGGELAAEAVNPSFLAIHPNHKYSVRRRRNR